jgi:tetratricopeptide (TPR) repeat protein
MSIVIRLPTRGFELPGKHSRQRIKQLQAQIHHLDKAHHHSQLGDIYFQQGKLAKAEASYRAAMERDPQDLDTRAHFGQCLLRQNARGRPPDSRRRRGGKSGNTITATRSWLWRKRSQRWAIDAAIATGQRVTENHSYARAAFSSRSSTAARRKRPAPKRTKW